MQTGRDMLDPFDVKLLDAVQRDAELTQTELAERVGLSPTQCARRLERLRRQGFVEAVVALLDPQALGFTVVAHTLVSLATHTGDSNERFHRFVEGSGEILECYSQTGEADFLLKVATRDLEHLSSFLERLIRAVDGISTLRSSIVLKTVKKTSALPLRT